jgi:hypothetical protein
MRLIGIERSALPPISARLTVPWRAMPCHHSVHMTSHDRDFPDQIQPKKTRGNVTGGDP